MLSFTTAILVLLLTLFFVPTVVLVRIRRQGWQALDLPISDKTYIVVEINHIVTVLLIAEIAIATAIVQIVR